MAAAAACLRQPHVSPLLPTTFWLCGIQRHPVRTRLRHSAMLALLRLMRVLGQETHLCMLPMS